MKNLKKPNYNQKQRIAKAKVNPMRVFVIQDDGVSLTVLDRDSGKTLKVIGKNFSEV